VTSETPEQGQATTGSERRASTWVGVLTGLLVGAVGFIVAVLASLVSRVVWRTGLLDVPWGLGLAVAGSVSVVVLARAVGRLAGFAAAGGWLIGLFYVFSPRPEGDYIIASDALGYSFLALSVLAVMATAAWGSAS
jgi:hypothetical protein